LALLRSAETTHLGGSPNAASAGVHVLQLHNLSLLSRIYIGSIHFELSEHDLRAAFSQFGPIRSISLTNDPVTGHHKGYCFMEFETPDAAALAVEKLNGSALGGRSIKIGRPNNFPTTLPPGMPPPLTTRLYIANIHSMVTETDVAQLMAAFGPLSHVSLVPDLPPPSTSTSSITSGAGSAFQQQQHKGYGYVQFKETKDAQTALHALKNGFVLGGLAIQVGRTILGGDFPAGMSILQKLPLSLPSTANNHSMDPAASASSRRLPEAVRHLTHSLSLSLTKPID
jgi:poly(U)-binding-splicing factor PUF60